MQKQYDTVQEVVRAIKGQPRASHKTIQESVANRLIQMSVGRVRLHNFETVENELCWVNGFRCLTDNKYSRIQMKRLDACRNRLLRWLKKHLTGVEGTDSTAKSKPRQIVYYGKPFSYYYHAIEKPREAPVCQMDAQLNEAVELACFSSSDCVGGRSNHSRSGRHCVWKWIALKWRPRRGRTRQPIPERVFCVKGLLAEFLGVG